MSETAIIGVPKKAQDMKRIRVFVKDGEHVGYGECSRRALQNARKHEGNVRVTFTKWKVSAKDKKDVIVGTFDNVVPAKDITYKLEAE